jgi:hypothetical protein
MQSDIFEPFFRYCFQNRILDEQFAAKLGGDYALSRNEEHGEMSSLLGASRVGRY